VNGIGAEMEGELGDKRCRKCGLTERGSGDEEGDAMLDEAVVKTRQDEPFIESDSEQNILYTKQRAG
jgi:hypothetical protein